MRKNEDIYEHLANIYFDSPRHKNKNYPHQNKARFKIFLKFGIGTTVGFLLVLIASIFFQNNASQNQRAIIIIGSEINKINFHNFVLAKKEIVTYDLRDKEINLLNYERLGFSARKSNFHDKLLIQIELVDSLGRKSVVNIEQIPAFKWKDFEIKLTEFKDIGRRTKLCSLAFIVQDWKTRIEKGAIYIDKVCLLR